MLDWWQAALLSAISAAVGGSIGLVTAYYTQRWTNSAAREAEERQAEHRAEEERRQAIRQLRLERIQPVFAFLDAAKRFRAVAAVEQQLEKTFRDRPQDQINLDAKESLRGESVGADPDIFQLIRQLHIAFASAPTVDIRQAVVFRVFVAAIKPQEEAGESLDDATIAAEEKLERYLTEA